MQQAGLADDDRRILTEKLESMAFAMDAQHKAEEVNRAMVAAQMDQLRTETQRARDTTERELAKVKHSGGSVLNSYMRNYETRG